MKTHFVLRIIALILLSSNALAITASERIDAVEKHTEGKSFIATAKMTVSRGQDERVLKMNFWWKDKTKALIRVLEPKKDKGTGNLRIGFDLWQYLPKVNRVIRIPSSMMLQSWMGSDFSNDDLVRGGSLFRDYTHKELGEEDFGGTLAVKIECLPTKDAVVVWGKVIVWVRKKDNVPLKQEFYSEAGKLLKVMLGENIQSFGTHTIPTKLTMNKIGKADSKTVIEYEPSTIKFDTQISDKTFTQENLRVE